ncbi:MAG TPA: sigma-70 family RNA polymerase sigma factor [Chitinophagaceae bacterium]
MVPEKEFVDLLNRHQNIIHKICHVYMDDPHDREDLFQEITLQAWKTFRHFRGDARFSTWLYRVALNTAITFFRKEKKKITAYTHQIPDDTGEPNPVEEQVQAMYRAISGLSKIDKALVMLYLEDYSYKEMAAMLGITVTNVGAKMNRIRTRLKQEIEKHYHPTN